MNQLALGLSAQPCQKTGDIQGKDLSLSLCDPVSPNSLPFSWESPLPTSLVFVSLFCFSSYFLLLFSPPCREPERTALTSSAWPFRFPLLHPPNMVLQTGQKAATQTTSVTDFLLPETPDYLNWMETILGAPKLAG